MDPAAVRVVNAYGNEMAAVRSRVVAYIERAWGSLDSWREADIERFVRAIVPVVEAGQVRTAALTDAYLAAFERTVLGGSVAPVGVPATEISYATIRGVPATEVYSRVGPTVWSALADGKDLRDAVNLGLRRAVQTAQVDMQRAKTQASVAVFARKDNVVGYRRVLRGSESCALCIIASTQRYRKRDLMPVHPGCDCGVSPIYGDRDPGQVIDPNRLEGLQDRLGERFGLDARKSATSGNRTGAGDWDDYRQLVVTHEHGELGPVLARKGDTFTAATDLPGPAKKAAQTAEKRRLTAADLSNAQGTEIADAALRLSRGEISRREYRTVVNRIRGDVEAA